MLTFGSGEEVVAAMEHRPVQPALVLLDVNMPGLDGFGCAQRLRGLDATRTVPIVMLSTSEHAADVQRARAAGADSCVAKPQGAQTWQALMHAITGYWIDTDLRGRL